MQCKQDSVQVCKEFLSHSHSTKVWQKCEHDLSVILEKADDFRISQECYHNADNIIIIKKAADYT